MTSAREANVDADGEGAPAPERAFLVAAFYKFVALDELARRAESLRALANTHDVKGTVLLAEEGINSTVSGPEAGVRALLAHLRADPKLADLEAKLSWAPSQGFYRFKVRIKREIVTMGIPQVKPAERVGTYVAPHAWDALVRDPETLVIDTRNSFEFDLGTFERAIDPATKSFGEFPRWVEETLRPLVAERKPKHIAMFCTGGIRCEKATSYLIEQGFEGVHHLQGGILKYLEDTVPGQGTFRGECFVFDQRVSVNERLEPGEAILCHACRMPLRQRDRSLASYVPGVSCHHCIGLHSNERRERFAEREHQVALATERGDAHLGKVMPRGG
jgi:UPF0176 protein